MSNMVKSLYNIRLLDELAQNRTIIHSIHPLSKLMVTTVYLITVVSFGKYEIGGLLPFILYPVVIMMLGDIPVLPILKRVLVVMPFVIGVGIFNPLIDHRTGLIIGNIVVSGGWISFFSIVIKFILTVTAALILLASTGMTNIASALRIIGVPRVFVLQLLLTYRYISVLVEEAARTTRAYSLRSPFRKGIGFRDWGSLAGQLLMRTMDRAQRIYQSMCCRGFDGEYNTGSVPKIAVKDVVYTFSWILFFICARYFDITGFIGLFITTGGVK